MKRKRQKAGEAADAAADGLTDKEANKIVARIFREELKRMGFDEEEVKAAEREVEAEKEEAAEKGERQPNPLFRLGKLETPEDVVAEAARLGQAYGAGDIDREKYDGLRGGLSSMIRTQMYIAEQAGAEKVLGMLRRAVLVHVAQDERRTQQDRMLCAQALARMKSHEE